MASKKFGAICRVGGRTIELTSEHLEWLDWAQNALYAAAQLEAGPGASAFLRGPYDPEYKPDKLTPPNNESDQTSNKKKNQ